MEKPKTFFLVVDNMLDNIDRARYSKKEDALMAASNIAGEDRCVIHVYQCSPTFTFNPAMEQRSWD